MKEYIIEEKLKINESKILKCHSAVCILPIIENGDILMISKMINKLEGWDLELPKGDVQYKEIPKEAAIRVLLTETGMFTNKIEPIGIYNPKGSSIDIIYLFVATELMDIKTNFTFTTDTYIVTLSPERLSELIRDGVFTQESGIKAFTKFYFSVL